jgi:hypothetical protein
MEGGRVGTCGLHAAPPVEMGHKPGLGYVILPLPLLEGRIVQGRMKRIPDVIYSLVQVHNYRLIDHLQSFVASSEGLFLLKHGLT